MPDASAHSRPGTEQCRERHIAVVQPWASPPRPFLQTWMEGTEDV